MAFLQVTAFLALVCAASADVSEIVGKNQYLPPSKGYHYDRPSIPFPSPSPTRPSPFQVPSARPTPSYVPPPSPTYKPVQSYIPPASPSRSPAPRPTPSYIPPSPSYQPSPSGGSGVLSGANEHDHHHHHEPGMPYDFEYKVKDDYFGTDYSRNEVSDGDVIKGEYRVQLPDGRLQIVRYTADWKNGYNADVSYQGQPTFGASGSGSYGQPSGGY